MSGPQAKEFPGSGLAVAPAEAWLFPGEAQRQPEISNNLYGLDLFEDKPRLH